MSNEEKSVHLVKLFQEDGEKFFQARTIAIRSEVGLRFEILLVDVLGNRAYSALLDQGKLTEMKQVSRCDDIEDLAVKAFTSSCQGFIFSLDHDKKLLAWKKGGLKVKIRLGMIPIEEEDVARSHATIFNTAVEMNETGSKKLSDLKARSSTLMDHLKEHRKKLEEFKEAKTELEQTMYEHFIPILNAKQDKIIQLTKELESSKKIRMGSDDEMETSSFEPNVHTVSSSDDDEEARHVLANTSIDSQNFLDL